MNTQTMLSNISAVLRQDFNSEVSLNSSIVVKSSPHQLAIRIHEIAEKDGRVWLHTDEGWNQIEASDVNANLVLSSIYQRLKFLSIKKEVA